MKLVYNDWIEVGLDEFLLSQDCIKDVKIKDEGYLTSIIVNLKKDLPPTIVNEFINLYQGINYSILFSFDKNEKVNTKN